jgi:hypothetical protein
MDFRDANKALRLVFRSPRAIRNEILAFLDQPQLFEICYLHGTLKNFFCPVCCTYPSGFCFIHGVPESECKGSGCYTIMTSTKQLQYQVVVPDCAYVCVASQRDCGNYESRQPEARPGPFTEPLPAGPGPGPRPGPGRGPGRGLGRGPGQGPGPGPGPGRGPADNGIRIMSQCPYGQHLDCLRCYSLNGLTITCQNCEPCVLPGCRTWGDHCFQANHRSLRDRHENGCDGNFGSESDGLYSSGDDTDESDDY